MADLSKIKIPNGTEYNLKDAQARADIESLNGSLEEIHDVEYHYYTSWVTGAYIDTSRATVDVTKKVTNANQMYIVINVTAGDIYGIKVSDGGVARGYCFIDSQLNVLEVSPGTGAVLETEIQAPANSAKLVLNSGISKNPYVYKKDNLVTVFREQASDIALLKQNPIFRLINTYNLIDYHTDIAWETFIDQKNTYHNVAFHSILDYIPVSDGDAFTSDKHLTNAFLYDEDYKYIRNITNPAGNPQGWWVIKIQEADAAYMRVMFKADNGANNPQLLKIDEPVALYKITTETLKSDRKLAVPKKQIDGRYVSKDIYDVSVPDVGSETDRRLNMRAIKRELANKGALRIGNFNIYGAMIKFVNWWVVQRELMDYGLNICGFEEVCVPTVDSDGNTLYDWSEVMVNEQFPYDDLIENQTGGARILSDCEVVSGGEYTHTVTVPNFGDVDVGYTKAVVKLPNYHHHRNWTKTMSIYVIHLSTTGAVAREQINYLVDVMNADTTEYKVLCSDTNCFRLDDNGKPWCWAYLAEAGLRPCLTDFNVSSYCYPISQEERDSGVLDMIDNVFITSNMKCIGWNIVDSQNYPIANVSGGYVSDHAMVYADVIFDYVDGFNDV